MKVLTKIYSPLIYSLLMVVFISAAHGEQTCVNCEETNVVGAPGIPLNGLDQVAAVEGAGKPAYPFKNYLAMYCRKYVMIERNELNQMIRDIKDTGYPVDDYFTTAACEPQKVGGGIRSPLLHLTAETPCTRFEFPPIIYKYYTVKRKEPNKWLEVVNAKNSAGETFLDFIETLSNQDDFSTDDTKKCAADIIDFACQTGGVYSKQIKTCPGK